MGINKIIITLTVLFVVSCSDKNSSIQMAPSSSSQSSASFTGYTTTIESTITNTSTNNTSIPITITFGEAPVSFQATNIVLTNATISNFAGSGTSYTANLIPTAEGVVNASISQNALKSSTSGLRNKGASFTINFDTTAPNVAITTPITNSFINIANNSTSFVFSGTCNEENKYVNLYLDTTQIGNPAICSSNNWSLTIDTTNLVQQALNFKAKLSDNAGNTGISSIISITKDTTAPALSITNPANSTEIAMNLTSYTVTGTCNTNGKPITVKIDNSTLATTPNCNTSASPNWSVTINPTSYIVGTHTITASYADAAGNATTTSNTFSIQCLTCGLKVSLTSGTGLSSTYNYSYTGQPIPSGGSITYSPAGSAIASAGSNITASSDNYPCAQFTATYLADATTTTPSIPPQTIYVYFTGTSVPTIYWDNKCSVTQTTTHGGTTNWVPVYNEILSGNTTATQQSAKNFFIKLLPGTQINLQGKIEGQTSAQAFTLTTSAAIAGTYPVKIVAGNSHTCALISDGTIRCWGSNTYGQLGDGTFVDKSVPTKVLGISTAKDIAATAITTCAYLTDKSVKCWGMAGNGRLGIAAPTTCVSPYAPSSCSYNNPSTVTPTIPAGSYYTAIYGGYNHTCVHSSTNGEVKCWGSNSNGQVGVNTIVDVWTPTVITTAGMALGTLASGTQVKSLALGRAHSCALMNIGAVYCWGANDKGQLGNSTVSSSNTLTAQITGITTGASVIASYYDHTCANVGGVLKCWGDDSYGQIGKGSISAGCGTSTTTFCEPTPTTGTTTQYTTSGVVDIILGSSHSCVSRTGTNLYCWGNSSNGRLGQTSPGSPQLTPKLTTTNISTISISGITYSIMDSGDAHACVYTGPQSGVSCWGLNTNGQVGNSSTSSSGVLTPTHILEL